MASKLGIACVRFLHVALAVALAPLAGSLRLTLLSPCWTPASQPRFLLLLAVLLDRDALAPRGHCGWGNSSSSLAEDIFSVEKRSRRASSAESSIDSG